MGHPPVGHSPLPPLNGTIPHPWDTPVGHPPPIGIPPPMGPPPPLPPLLPHTKPDIRR